MLGANTTAVQMAAPVWKLLDQPSYIYCGVLHNYKGSPCGKFRLLLNTVRTIVHTCKNTAIGGQRYPVQQSLRNRSTDLKLSPETRKLYSQWNHATSKNAFFMVFPQSLQANSRMLPLIRHHRDFLPNPFHPMHLPRVTLHSELL